MYETGCVFESLKSVMKVLIKLLHPVEWKKLTSSFVYRVSLGHFRKFSSRWGSQNFCKKEVESGDNSFIKAD